MGIGIGNLLGAINGISSAFSKPQSVKSFISTLDSSGVQITSRYEVIFSGIPQASFYIQSINVPGMIQNTTYVYFDGKKVEVPQNFEYNHDFSMQVINDSSGMIYTALTNFVMSNTGKGLADSGYTMTIKSIGDDKHKGSSITMNGVRIKTVGELNFDHSGGNVQTFSLNCSAIDFSSAAGSMGTAAGIGNAIGNILG